MSHRLAAALVLLPAAAFAWGFDGHRRLASNLEEPFPTGSCLRGWLSTVTGQFSWQDKSCDPDRWRNTDSAEGPRHYLNIDYADPIDSYPRDWPEVQARFGGYAYKNGYVPWRVEELYAQLVADMKAGNGAKALDTVAYLSHYVTDAFSPMHDTKDQPGSCGGTPECLHLRYESDVLNVNSQIDAITQAARGYYGQLGKADPRNNIFDIVIVGQPLGQKIIYDDINNQQSTSALYTNTRDITARRWGDALTLMASLIGTAWVEAGKPTLSGMPSGCSTDVAQGEVVLSGYAFPPPRPDAGTPAEDAGTNTGSDGGPNGGGHSGGGLDLDAGTGQVPGGGGGGCGGCGGGPIAALLPAFACGLLMLRRRPR